MTYLMKRVSGILFVVLLAMLVATGSAGAELASAPPVRVVSLVPTVTEMLVAIGAGESLVGITYHDENLPGAAGKAVVGGFAAPSLELIGQLNPDVIITADLHEAVVKKFAVTSRILSPAIKTLAGSEATIRALGKIFSRQAEAEQLLARNRATLAMMQAQLATVPPEKRLRVLRVMGTERAMVPGDDSFQNEMIRAAGGVPPIFGRTGEITVVSEEEWQRFDPQVIYGCGDFREEEHPFYLQPEYAGVAAVREGRILSFPCDLTCRPGVRVGDLVSWLAARLYPEAFADQKALVAMPGVIGSRALQLDLPVVANARIIESRRYDFLEKTLLVEFSSPQTVLSTLEGFKSGVTTVGNHFFPPPTWGLGHEQGVDPLRQGVLAVLGRDSATTSLLFTGADLDHLAVAERSFREIKILALATAGVRGNALRTSRDSGGYYEIGFDDPGTINIILLTNTRMTPRAMSRALITVTEAKAAALLDLDIRSSYTGARNRATGTGTDNILVVGGVGPTVDNTGGHTKMGELIAAAVHEAVGRAIAGQNGIMAGRSVISRLAERKIELSRLVREKSCCSALDPGVMTASLEQVLLEPRYAGFVAAALAVSDAQGQGQIVDLAAFRDWSLAVAGELAGHPLAAMQEYAPPELPPVLRLALDALLNGIAVQKAGQ